MIFVGELVLNVRMKFPSFSCCCQVAKNFFPGCSRTDYLQHFFRACHLQTARQWLQNRLIYAAGCLLAPPGPCAVYRQSQHLFIAALPHSCWSQVRNE